MDKDNSEMDIYPDLHVVLSKVDPIALEGMAPIRDDGGAWFLYFCFSLQHAVWFSTHKFLFFCFSQCAYFIFLIVRYIFILNALILWFSKCAQLQITGETHDLIWKHYIKNS